MAQSPETPLEIAEKAASWVMDEAIPEAGGYKWPFFTSGGKLYYQSDIDWGAAGFGMFFLSLYEKTHNSTYIEYAEGASKWLITQAVSEAGGYGYKWPHADDDLANWWLSTSVAGIAEFLLRIYQITGSSIYLSYAEDAARWMMAMAQYEWGGCFIPYNPPGKYGSQAAHGISPGGLTRPVIFLLHLYEETDDSVYLPYIHGMAKWLMASGPPPSGYKISENGGYKWYHNYPYGEIYPINGMSQIALFFYEIYQVFGNATYLEHANGAMTWLLSQAILDGDKAKWRLLPGSDIYTLPFTGSYEGTEPKTCNLLEVAYSVTKNATYLEYARKLANWVISPDIAVSEGGGYKFRDIEGGSDFDASQNARVNNFLSWMYNLTGEASYSQYALGALTWIVYKAEPENGGYKWKAISYYPFYATWFDSGAAGIGYYLTSTSGVIPEFPSATFLATLMTVTLFATVLVKKKQCRLMRKAKGSRIRPNTVEMSLQRPTLCLVSSRANRMFLHEAESQNL